MDLIMNSDEVFELIESVGRTPGKNDKISMLKACAGSNLLRSALKMAYDPTISYGIRAVPERTQPGAGHFDADTWRIIDALSDRTLTGSAMYAKVLEEVNRLSESSSQLFKRILLKDMRAGFSDTTTNKVFPGLAPEFPYMRCCLPKDAKLNEFDWAAGVFSQEKADGMFSNVNHEATGEVFIYSRQGSMFPMEKFEELTQAIRATFMCATQSHGEMLVLRDGVILAREIGNGILNSVLKGGDFEPNERPVFFAWDQIPLAAVRPKGGHSVPYRSRFRVLLSQIMANKTGILKIIPTRIVKSLKEAYQHYAELLADGKEGTIIKNPDAPWKDGTSKFQVKLKLEFVVDLEIVGFEAGNGKNAATFGSIIAKSADGLLVVAVSGFTDGARRTIAMNKNDYLGTIMAVKANGIMRPSADGKKHSLFLPRFVEFRLDKKVADTLSQVFDQEEAAKQGVAIAQEAMKEAA